MYFFNCVDIISELADNVWIVNIICGLLSLAIYDDRVEIINPGAFPPNLTMEELRAGNTSELRNPVIARVMYARKALEAWGRGIKLIMEECAKAELPEPQIVSEGGYSKTVFIRPNGGGEAIQRKPPRKLA